MNQIKKIAAVVAFSTLTMSSVFAKDYWGAELYTGETYQYGRFEARMQMAAESGLVSSMFLYHNDSYMGGAEPWVEVDIEVLGKNPSSFQSNIITGVVGNQVTSEQHHQINPASNQSFHVYAMEWTDRYVAWFLDGVEVRRNEVGSSDYKNQVQALVRQQGLRFNIWSSEDPGWVGNFDPSKLPLYQYIDWVKVYDYTPDQGDAGSGNNFKLRYADDFNGNSLNSRWNAGDWTFDGNRVDIKPENVAVRDGYAIIGITRAYQGVESANIPMPNDPNKGLQAANPVVPSEPEQPSEPEEPTPSEPEVPSEPEQPTNPWEPWPPEAIRISNLSAPFKAQFDGKAVLLQVPQAGVVRYEILDAKGAVKLSENKHFAAGSFFISLTNLSSGTYFMNIYSGSTQKSLKILKH